MRYSSAGAFRAALEDRLKSQASTDGRVDTAFLSRLRKRVTFERFLARLQDVAPDAWVLKGGFALEVRLGDAARTTKDVDVDWLEDEQSVADALLDAARWPLEDYFDFEIARGEDPDDVDLVGQGQRWKVVASVAGRTFERVSVDVGVGRPIVPIEQLVLPAMLEFAEIRAVSVASLSIEQHLAEKVHAYTRVYGSTKQATSRVKDLLDMALVAVTLEPRAKEMRTALDGIFERRGTHSLPGSLPPPPGDWNREWAILAVDLPVAGEPAEGHAIAARLIDPVLAGGAIEGRWDSVELRWRW